LRGVPLDRNVRQDLLICPINNDNFNFWVSSAFRCGGLNPQGWGHCAHRENIVLANAKLFRSLVEFIKHFLYRQSFDLVALQFSHICTFLPNVNGFAHKWKGVGKDAVGFMRRKPRGAGNRFRQRYECAGLW